MTPDEFDDEMAALVPPERLHLAHLLCAEYRALWEEHSG